ncbi:hypothetical protein TYRP_010192 [Tyrophagus putrescentiae]|nr:hypothetical protein TYRP_010192 [Tyrophagus putrescentiae]
MERREFDFSRARWLRQQVTTDGEEKKINTEDAARAHVARCSQTDDVKPGRKSSSSPLLAASAWEHLPYRQRNHIHSALMMSMHLFLYSKSSTRLPYLLFCLIVKEKSNAGTTQKNDSRELLKKGIPGKEKSKLSDD